MRTIGRVGRYLGAANVSSDADRAALGASLVTARVTGADRLEIASNWIGNGQRSIEDLEFVFKQFTNIEKRKQLFDVWSEAREGEQIGCDEMQNVLPLVQDPKIKSQMAQCYLSDYDQNRRNLRIKSEKTFAEINAIVPHILDGAIPQVINSWIFKRHQEPDHSHIILGIRDEMSFEDIRTILNIIPDNDSGKSIKSSIAEVRLSGSLSSSYKENLQRPFEELQELLPYLSEERKGEKLEILTAWVEHPQRTKAELESACQLIGAESESTIILNWLTTSKQEVRGDVEIRPQRTVEDVTEFLPRINKNQHANVSHATIAASSIADYISGEAKWQAKPQTTFEEIKAVWDYLHSDMKGWVLDSWIVQPARTIDDLQNVLELGNFGNKVREKLPLLENWVARDGCTKEDLQFVFELVANDQLLNLYGSMEGNILSSWVGKSARTTEDFNFALGLAKSDDQREVLRVEWFFNSSQTQTIAELADIRSQIKDEGLKSQLVDRYLLDENRSTEDFANLVRAGIVGSNVYDVRGIVDAYAHSNIPVGKFPELCRDLFPNNIDLQSEAVVQAIKVFDKSKIQAGKADFLSFVTDVADRERAWDVIVAIKAKITLSSNEVLDCTSKHLSENYQSVAEILQGSNVAQSLTREGLKTFKQEFKGVKAEKVSLANLFSYYNLQKDGLILFQSLLQPEILSEMARNFVPSDHKVLVLDRETEQLQFLVNGGELSSHRSIDLPSVTEVSGLLSKRIKLPNFPLNEIDNFTFGASEALEKRQYAAKNEAVDEAQFAELNQQKRQQYLQEKTMQFRGLLKKETCSAVEVADFFESIFGRENKINPEEQKVLCDFFNRDKFLLAKLLNSEQGLDRFMSMAHVTEDGCYANIGTHARLAVVDSVISAVDLRVIFSVFSRHISHPVLARESGVDHVAQGADASTVFQDKEVNKHYISPTGLVKKIMEEFYHNGKKVRDSWEVVRNHYGSESEEVTALVEIPDCELQAAKLATFLIVEKHFPQFLQNKYLVGFKQEGELIRQQITQKAAELKAEEEAEKKPTTETPSNSFAETSAKKLSRKNEVERRHN